MKKEKTRNRGPNFKRSYNRKPARSLMKVQNEDAQTVVKSLRSRTKRLYKDPGLFPNEMSLSNSDPLLQDSYVKGSNSCGGTDMKQCNECNQRQMKSIKANIKYPEKKPNFKDSNNYCHACDETFKSVIKFHAHLLKIHPFQFRNCWNSKIINVNRVMDINNNRNNYCCACECTFIKRRVFLTHLKNVHQINQKYQKKRKPIVPYPEKASNAYRYNRNNYDSDSIAIKEYQDLDNRSIVHPNSIPNKEDNFCDLCSYTFLTASSFRVHLLFVHNIETNLKKKVETEVKTKDGNTVEKTVEKKVVKKIKTVKEKSEKRKRDKNRRYCHTCSTKFDSKYELSVHMIRSHNATLITNNSWENHSTIKPLINDANNFCRVCDRHYSNRNTYLRHLAGIHSMKVEKVIKNDSVPDVGNTNNYCSECKKTYSKPSNFRRHLFNIHPKTHSLLTKP